MISSSLSRLSTTLAMTLCAALIGVAWLHPVSARGGTADGAARVSPVPYDKWKWFEDTYWIVPPRGIYSILHLEEGNKFAVIRGQTVFHITDYFNGYWTGAVVVKLSRALIPSCQYVLGQITPEGRVEMTMYDTADGSVVNYPTGTMVKRGGWTMVNEMTNVVQGGTLSHWAYMVQSERGDPSWRNLPFAHESIPKFMSACPPGPKIDEA